jgi:signal transduction histidine kinase/DNA-binding response OmpR family regulator
MKRLVSVLYCLLILVGGAAGAAPPLALRDTTQDYSLGLHWNVLLAPRPNGRALTLAEIQSPAWAARFEPSQQQVPNLPQQESDIWLRCTLRNYASADTRWVLRGKLAANREFEVFVVDATGRVRRQEARDDLPYDQTHLVPDLQFNLPLHLPPGPPHTLYIHTYSGLLNFSITEEDHLQQLVRQRDVMAALYFSALLTLMLYNLLLFASVRDRSYLYYVLYVAAFGALQADMMGYLHWLWPAMTGGRPMTVQMSLVALVIIFSIFTARSFLETHRLVPRLDRLLRIMVGVALLPVLSWVLPFHALTFWLSVAVPLAACLALLVAGVAVQRTGYRPARYYMAGWGVLILAIIIFYLRTINVLPVSFITEYGVRISSVLEMVLLSLGLASRINTARRAQQEAQAQALLVLREKEEVQQAANRELAARADELERAYEELRASLATTDQLQTLDELKTRFFTNISHELRTPLTLIISPLEHLLGEAALPAAHPELSLMHRNARRLLHLINQLLDIARLEAGSMSLLAAPIDLDTLIQAAVSTFTPLAQSQDVTLQLEVEPNKSGGEVEPLYADQDKLEQILYNLLSNALKFTPAGGQVRVRLAQAAGWVEIAVQDTGIGIAEEELPRVFERFHQADASHTRRYGGSGVGLALVRELVALHGGSITACSQVGEGSTFRVCLPLGAAHLQPHEIGPALADDLVAAQATSRWVERPVEASLPGEAAEVVTADPRPLVLLVDDNDDMRQYLRQCLGPAYRLLMAADGEQGLARTQAALPDLIISDLMMPGLDGLELCQRLKTDERTSHIPVVLLTARSSEGSRLRGLETGADDYLTKPFHPAELRTRVSNLIAQRRQLRERFSREVTLQPRDISITSADEAFLTRALAVVELHLANADFDVETFASALAISRVQLYRKLKALTDQAPTDFVRVLRLRRAAQLLASQAGNVAEVAYAVGFNNLSYFSKCFREMHGHAPSGHFDRPVSEESVPV